MKNVIKIFLIVIIFLYSGQVYAEENNVSNDEILDSQQQELGISDFIKSSKEYTKDGLDGIDIKEVFKGAITGKVGNINLFNSILNLFGREFRNSISSLRNNIYNNSNTQPINCNK